MNSYGGVAEPTNYGRSFDEKEIRKRFVFKVYSLLSLQLLVTVGIVCTCIFVPVIKEFLAEDIIVMIVSGILAMVFFMILLCVQCARMNVPLNYILLTFLTLCYSTMIGSMSAKYETLTVLAAVAVTTFVVIVITLIALLPCCDVTGWGLYFFIAGLILSVFGIIAMILGFFFHMRVLFLVYAGLATLLFSMKKMRSLAIVSIGSTVAFSFINIYKGNERFYKEFLMPVVHQLDPETAHRLAILVSKYRLLPKSSFVDPDPLRTNLFGRHLSNPVGIAAGFDKHGEAVIGLSDIGFGFVEIGSVTPQPQDGNDRPRVFRLKEDLAVINRYGFNSDGHSVVHARLTRLKQDPIYAGVLGINLGKNKTSEDAIGDYVKGIEKFGALADYFVINVSSPNTPGLRNMQNKEILKDLLQAVVRARDRLKDSKPALLLKLAPDLSHSERKDIAEVLKTKGCNVDGLIISNTTVGRAESLQSGNKAEIGGLSGRPVGDISTEMIRDMYSLTNGMTIIGVGGIFSGKDAYEKIKAGASAVQIYTALVYDGPPLVTKIKKELVELLAKDSYSSISEAVGKSNK